ncbi:MAG: Gfo/Idh/MocA family oxidoreductase [Pirellulales bacterium]|nr:Gfo/Idh/MocA family oxidoreductase [Pirellulales bacterium]
MSHQSNRRTFLQTSAVAGVGFWAAGGIQAQESKSPNERIRFACFGTGGKGSSDTGNAAKHGEIVAICDVDKKRLDGAKKRYAKTVGDKAYTDFRKLLDENEKDIDAVTVSTPDHCHAIISAAAMRRGKHCFTQKPLTRSIYEARYLGNLAKEKGVGTQMGNQGVANNAAREAAAIVQAGGLGTLQEVHVWTNRPVWPQGGKRPAPSEAPSHLDWESWIGPSPMRPYAKGYHPFSWRGWWDFGTGALGDMACHTVNMPFWAADLGNPVSVEATTSGHNKDSFPSRSTIKFEMAKTDSRPAINFYWYDGGNFPPAELFTDGIKRGRSGALIVGDKGKMIATGDYGQSYKLFAGATKPENIEYTKSPGHVQEWINAIRGGEKASSDFAEHAGKLTETILLGNLAVWSGKRVEWDSENMKAKNMPELDAIIKPVYRKGYSLEG